MAVPFDEARHCELTGKVDRFRALTDVALDLRVGAERHDAAAAGGERLHVCRRLEGGNPAVVEHEIGGRHGLALRDECCGAGQGRDNDGKYRGNEMTDHDGLHA